MKSGENGLMGPGSNNYGIKEEQSFSAHVESTKVRQRNNMEVWTPAEKAIYDAMQEVEKMPADTLLTEAVILLENARHEVADFLDKSQG